MTLLQIIKHIPLDGGFNLSENSPNPIETVVLDSREAFGRQIFVAIKGFKTDGHQYISQCYQNGCRDFVIENPAAVMPEWQKDSTIIVAKDSRTALALISNYINSFAYNQLNMIGITGTKGKTTVTTLLHRILGADASMFSTVKNIVGQTVLETERTTLEAPQLEGLLKKSVMANQKYAVVEVSSHAVTLKRVLGIQWDAGIFTSFSRDHLDLYGTMKNYFEAKLDFFRQLNASEKRNKLAVINIDDPKGEAVCSVIHPSVKTIRVGKSNSADYQITDVIQSMHGIELTLQGKHNSWRFTSRMQGEFNVGNLALATVCALELGIDAEHISGVLHDFRGAEGRFEMVVSEPFSVIVDYAHSPDSLGKILSEARKISRKRVIILFGCTGDRDRDKRRIMGRIAAANSDYCIITNDDTYTEDPVLIAAAVEQGLRDEGKVIGRDYHIILDRKTAIKEIVTAFAQPGDVVVLAGMGHEKYQIINNTKVPHNDKDEVLKYRVKRDGSV